MSEENVRIARASIEVWDTGDLDSALDDVHPDIVWINSGTIPDLPTEYRGHKGVRQFWADWREVWEQFTIELEQVLDVGDEVVTLERFDGVARLGIRVSDQYGHVFTF